MGEGGILGIADYKDAVVGMGADGLAVDLDQGGEGLAQSALR